MSAVESRRVVEEWQEWSIPLPASWLDLGGLMSAVRADGPDSLDRYVLRVESDGDTLTIRWKQDGHEQTEDAPGEDAGWPVGEDITGRIIIHGDTPPEGVTLRDCDGDHWRYEKGRWEVYGKVHQHWESAYCHPGGFEPLTVVSLDGEVPS